MNAKAPSNLQPLKPRPTCTLEEARVRYVYGATTAEEAVQVERLRLPSLKDLAESTNLSLNTLEQRCRKEGWPDQRRRAQAKLQKDRDAWIRTTLLAEEMQARWTWWAAAHEIAQELRRHIPGASPTELAALASAVRRIQEIGLVALGKPKDGQPASTPEAPAKEELSDWTIMRRIRAGLPARDT